MSHHQRPFPSRFLFNVLPQTKYYTIILANQVIRTQEDTIHRQAIIFYGLLLYNIVMDIVLYFINYIIWHYTRAIKDLIRIWSDFVWFTFNFFSISLLLKTFFSPWKRLGEMRSGFFDPVFIIIDIFMRLFGMLLRSVTIFVGLVSVTFVILLGPVILTIWLIWPIAIFYLLNSGLTLLFKQ